MAQMTVESAEGLLRKNRFSQLKTREARREFGRAKALLAANNRLASIGRFPPGAGEPSTAHRKRVAGKK